MAPIEKKRRREDASFASKKRQKAEQWVGGETRPGSGATTAILESLPWHEVPLPDYIGDAEGFFGLEEISDVDVVKSSGKVEYKVRQRNSQTRSNNNVNESAGDEEWEGFGETRQTGLVHTKSAASKTSRQTESKPIPYPNQKGGQKLLEQNQGRSSGNTFDVLGDENETDPGGGDMSAWESLSLSTETISSLANLNFYRPSPIQASALPYVLEGHDAICKAPTGSGKTLVFGIPIYEHCIATMKARAQGSLKPKQTTEPKYNPVALILSPTRELAHQLAKHLQQLGSGSDSSPKIATLTGGLSMHKQQRLLPNADIVIATPGRLKEIVDGNSALAEALRDIRFLILDEADRLLSSGHFQELEEILIALDREKATDKGATAEILESSSKRQRQTLVFSATFEKDLQQKLAGRSKSSSGDSTGQASMEYLLKRLNFREQKPRFIDINPGVSFSSTNNPPLHPYVRAMRCLCRMELNCSLGHSACLACPVSLKQHQC